MMDRLPRLALMLVALASLLAGCATPQAAPDATAADPDEAPSARSPYVGEEAREVKALSPEDVEALLTGAGYGYAKAAELNSYPGPAHVLDMREQLELTDEQATRLEQIRARMKEDAIRVGTMLVDAEADLDRLFASGEADAEGVSALTREIGVLEGELRAIHLNTHLETRALLTQHQVVLYDELRGYGGGERHAEHAHESGGH